MIPIPLPQPPPQYVPVSIEWSRKRRRQLGLTGSVLVLVSLAVAGAGIPLVVSLPDMGGVPEIMWVAFLAVSVFFSFAMGVLCLLGVSYIKNGWLNLTAAQGLSRSSLVVWIFSVIGGVLGAAVLALGGGVGSTRRSCTRRGDSAVPPRDDLARGDVRRRMDNGRSEDPMVNRGHENRSLHACAREPINFQIAVDGIGDSWAKPDNGVGSSDGGVSDGDPSNGEAR